MMNHLLMPLIIMLFVSACGKTGALYLPDAEQDAAAEKTSLQNITLNSEEANRGSL